MISTPSYPPRFASAAAFAKSVAVRSISFAENARGRNGLIGLLRRDALLTNGW